LTRCQLPHTCMFACVSQISAGIQRSDLRTLRKAWG
jgi:hypothetical protein